MSFRAKRRIPAKTNRHSEPREQRAEYFELNRINLIQNMQTRLTRPQEQAKRRIPVKSTKENKKQKGKRFGIFRKNIFNKRLWRNA